MNTTGIWCVALIALASATACEKNRSSTQGAPDDVDVNEPRKPIKRPTPTAKVVFRAGRADQAVVLVEVVRTKTAITRGLMFRRSMPMNQGMLFLMARRRVQSFWMRNTLIPLDMIFIDEDMSVVGLVRDTVPMDDSNRSVGKPSRYVLEVNAGWAKANRVDTKTVAKFVGVELH